ncbi:MAG: nucleoside hydrolase [Chloroflexota bacterium]|nr:nucleoside hydrolase [Chloroflexota bacterium]
MNKNWKLLIPTALIFSLLVGCATTVEEPAAENKTPTITSEMQEEDLPTSTPQLTEDIFPDPLSGKIPVIYSHGGAPCDIGGMVYLTKHPNVDLIGLVLSRGEIHPEIAVDLWPIFLYDVLNSNDTAIALGSDVRMDPFSHEFPEAWRPSADNFWGLTLPAQVTEFEPALGPELIIELVNNSPDKVTLVAMASMIDIALALQEDPGIIDNISHVVIMGGAFNMPGNLDEGPEPTSNEAAEWNMYIDSQAAKYVLNSGVPMSIVPLDAIQYYVQPEDHNSIKTIDDPGVKYVSEMWGKQFDWANGGFFIWDTITVTAVTNPENFNWTYDGVDVITEPGDFQGQTIALNNGATHTRFATDADYGAILDQLIETFRGETTFVPPANGETGASLNELAGTWEGFTGNFHITFFLEPECKLNEKCGTFEIPDFSLSGDITFVDIDGDVFEFKATNMSSGQPSNDYEYLQLLDDGTLFYSTTGSGVTNEAVLERK